ncbi:MAG: hypothetical protein R3302_04825 [Sulfurimonadaceae bacterium]|nr:hypothetical protein [Sulfurimonadaceae bacterium]
MKLLEKKLQETIRDGVLVSKGMQPLAKHMLHTIKSRPAAPSTPSPNA